MERVETKSKLRLYRKLKTKLTLEDYVVELPREKRRILTMLRGGTNRLRIETGRWVGEREEERVCKVCLSNEVEDETHFLLACPFYVIQRTEMFAKIREACNLDDIEMMNNDWQLEILIGVGWRKSGKGIREIVLEYVRKAYMIRNKYV